MFQSRFPTRAVLALSLAACFAAGAAQAQDRHDFERREHEIHEHEFREPFRAPHWVFDNRHDHGRYYPALGYVVPTLPGGYLSLGFGARHLFFRAGVWYEPGPGGYVVVRPPRGAVVPVLPPGYATVWVGRVPYYYANEVYYTAGPGGYVVADPPTEYVEAPPAESAPADAPAPGASGATWYYCKSSGIYYPYAQTCPEGWLQVPATPAPPR